MAPRAPGTDRSAVNKDVYGPICRPGTGQDVTDLWNTLQAHRENFPPLSVMHFPEKPVLRPARELPDTGIGILKGFGFLETL